MKRSQLGDQISAHISKSSNGGDMRHLLQIVYEIADPARRAAFEDHVKSAYSQNGCGYWHAMPNVIFVKVPPEMEDNTGVAVHPDLVEHLDKDLDQLMVLGPLWEVDSDDSGLYVDDAVDFGQALV